MGTATYKADGQVYEIPDNEKESFIKDIPHAEEVQSFTAGKDTFDIPLKEVPDFVKDMPEAKPLKKKRFGGNYHSWCRRQDQRLAEWWLSIAGKWGIRSPFYRK